MEWENKVKMIRLGNNRETSPEAKKEFQDYVLENITEFDTQAWDMFVELSDINIEEMTKDIEYWKQIYPHIIIIDCNNPKFGFRTGLRISLIQTICEDELKLSQNQ